MTASTQWKSRLNTGEWQTFNQSDDQSIQFYQLISHPISHVMDKSSNVNADTCSCPLGGSVPCSTNAGHLSPTRWLTNLNWTNVVVPLLSSLLSRWAESNHEETNSANVPLCFKAHGANHSLLEKHHRAQFPDESKIIFATIQIRDLLVQMIT